MRSNSAKIQDARIARLFLAEVRRDVRAYLRRVNHCLELLREKQIWWRPNSASNSAGNLALHLSGNVRQWIISGLGGAPDLRDRDSEFAARGISLPVHSRKALLRRLNSTMREADRVLGRLTAQNLSRRHRIQGYHVSGLAAVAHVYSHFTYHAGQILYLTKLLRGKDLRFTNLPQRSQTNKAASK